MLYIVELYHGYANGILPANTQAGIAGQNPRLLEAFQKLAAKDAEIREQESKG